MHDRPGPDARGSGYLYAGQHEDGGSFPPIPASPWGWAGPAMRRLTAACLISVSAVSAAGAVPPSTETPTPPTDFVVRNGAGLALDGLPFHAAGANAYYLMPYAADPGLRAAVDELLNEAALMGLNTVRTWGFGEGDGWGALQTAPGVYNETVFQGLDYVLDLCSRLGLRVVLPLVNNWTDYGGMDQYVAWSPTAAYHDDFYTDAACLGWYADHLAAMVNRVNTLNGHRYRDDPTILAWELANEPRCPSDPSGDTLQEWVETMSALLQDLDPNHLVGTGSEGFYNDAGAMVWYLDGSQGVDYLRNNAAACIDVAGGHAWPDPWGIDPSQAVSLLSRQASDAAGMLGKPFILGEFGKLRDTASLAARDGFVLSARAHYDPATYFSPGVVPGPVPGASPIVDPSARFPRPRSRTTALFPRGNALGSILPETSGRDSPRALSTTARDAFFASCFQVLGEAGGDGGIYWAAYHDGYPDYDGFGVYYPADTSTVALVEGFAASFTAPVPTGPPLTLGTPYPNPFKTSTTLPLTILAPGSTAPWTPQAVRAAVYDLQGRLVQRLYDGRPGAGELVVSWSGRDTRGIVVPPGVYFLRVWSGSNDWTRKAVKLRE